MLPCSLWGSKRLASLLLGPVAGSCYGGAVFERRLWVCAPARAAPPAELRLARCRHRSPGLGGEILPDAPLRHGRREWMVLNHKEG